MLIYRPFARNLAMQPDDPAQMHAAALHAQKLESIGQLAAGIAHEMNTPIQWVGDNTRFLKESFAILMEVIAHCQRLIDAAAQQTMTDEIVQEAVTAIRQADLEYLSVDVPKAIDQSLEGIDRAARIVRAMKEFSHPDKAQKVPTDIHKCIETTITVARNEWKYVAVVAKLFDPGLPTVTCIPGDFNQVILNLIVNAAHAIGDRVGDGCAAKASSRSAPRRTAIGSRSGSAIPAPAFRRPSVSGSSIRSSPPRKLAREPARAWPSRTP